MKLTSTVMFAAACLTVWGCGDDAPPSGNDAGTRECETTPCFRPIECVAMCGGPLLSSSCCPCPAGQLDRDVDCPACEDTPGCVEVCEGGDCSCQCAPPDQDGGSADGGGAADGGAATDGG